MNTLRCLALLAVLPAFAVPASRAQTNVFPTSGNVGIGTTSPGQALESSVYCSSIQLRLRRTGTSPAFADFGVDSEKGFSIWPDGYGTTSTAPKFVITPAGNVGIGISSGLVAKLDVNHAGTSTTLLANRVLTLRSGGLSADNTLQFSDGVAYNAYISMANGSLFFSDNNAAPIVVFQLGGNVGIGTTTPTEKLAVNGRIRAKEVIVETNWSDFVFDPGYRLAPLSEVERQIRVERHLPGIPSAQDVGQGGVSLGEMQARLLQKIEELTLHAIEQQKQLSTQQDEIRILKAEIARLSTRN